MQPGLNPKEPFLWGAGGKPKTPEQIARERQMAEAILARAGDTSPVEHWSQGAARVVDALGGVIRERRADRAESANMEHEQSALSRMLGGTAMSGGSSAGASMAPGGGAPANTSSGPDFSNVQPAQNFQVDPTIRDGIASTASALGIDPIDLATAISYETAGTFDPTKRGPTTQWGQHRGLIQFGEPQARQHGVNWDDPVGSQLGPEGAVANYLRSSGVTPGMGLLDIYSAINAGAPGLYNRSDANNGGAPGTVRDKVEQQMAGHRAKAMAMFADMANAPAPGAANAGGQQDIASALAALHPENQQQASYASMPGADNAVYRGQFDGVSPEQMQRQPVNRGELDGVDPQSLLLRRQPGAQPVHPLDAAARLSQDTQSMGMPADQTQELAAALLGRQVSAQEAGISPRVPGAGRDFQNVQQTGDVAAMGGAPGAFGLTGPGVQAGQMGVTPRTPFEGASSAVEMGMQPAPAPEAAPPMQAPVNVPPPPPVASVADMPARQAMAAQGQQQPAFMQAVNDPSIDPDAFGAGESMSRSVGNVLAARSFIEQGRPVPERLQSLIEGDMQRASMFGGGQQAQAQPSMAPADPRQAVAQAMMAGGGQQGGMAAGGAPMPAQADPRRQVAQAMASRSDQAMQIMMDPRMSPQARQMAQMIFQQEQAQQQSAQERAMQQQQLQQAGIDPNYAGIDPLISAAAGARYRAPDSEIQRFEYGQENPEFVEQQERLRRAGATNIDNRNMGTIPPGWEVVEEGDSRRMQPFPGGPVEREFQEEERANQARSRNARDYARTVTQDIGIADDYLSNLGPISGSDNVVGANLRNARAGVPGTPEYNMSQFMDSALSNVTLDTMNRMRETSAAGATGMGNMSDNQLRTIRGVLGQWSPGLPVEDQRYILHRLGNFYLDVQVGTADERAEAVRDGRMSEEENSAIQEMYYPDTRDGRGRRIGGGEAGTQPAPQGEAPPAPEGVDPELWQLMTPEERALWQ